MGIESVIVGTQLRRGIHLPRNILQQFLVHIFRERLGDIDIPCKIALGGGGLLVNRHKGDLLDHRFGVIPVVRVRHRHQLLIDHTVFQNIGAVAHQAAGPRPVRPAVDIRLLHRIEGKAGGQVAEPRQWFIQLHPALPSIMFCALAIPASAANQANGEVVFGSTRRCQL
ncbi:Uncharacterised protein [Klebsiella pneumoniae]|nr:Uncharacterised protein [Klebsiella pneumoniae]